MKNLKYILTIIFFATIVTIPALPFSISAQESYKSRGEYTLLAPLPKVTDCTDEQVAAGNVECKTDIKKYVEGMFQLLLGLASVFTVGSIVYGGFEYITTDNFMGKSDGIKRIQNSLWGLVLVICSWIVLYTINPRLIQDLDLNIEPAVLEKRFNSGSLTPPSTPGRPMTEDELVASEEVKLELESANITVYKGPCAQGQTTLCVNLNGLNQNLIDGAKSLKSSCNCNITITGGTEAGHSTGSSHNTGNALDMSFESNLDKYISDNKTGAPERVVVRNVYIGDRYMVNVNGKTMTFLKELNPPHWHVEMR